MCYLNSSSLHLNVTKLFPTRNKNFRPHFSSFRFTFWNHKFKSYYNNIYRSNLGSCRTYDLICVISYFIWYYISIRFVFLTTKSVQTHWENHLKSLNSAMFVCVVYYENIIEWFHVEIGFEMVNGIKRDIETNALNISFVF